MTKDERAATIVRLFPRVRLLARRVARMVPGAEMDELLGDGALGLIRAVDSYNASRGATLERYVHQVVTGAMLNGLRKRDPVSERARRTIREAERVRYELAQQRGSLPSIAEMERLSLRFARANQAVFTYTPLSLDGPALTAGCRDDKSENPAELVAAQSVRNDLQRAVAGLPLRERRVIELHYGAAQPLRCVAHTLAVSAQRASQLHLAALKRLRKVRYIEEPVC